MDFVMRELFVPLAHTLSGSSSLQQQSNLFSRLPTEVRHVVWRHALRSYEDHHSHPYDPRALYCRPGRRAKPIIDVQLLQTCRAVYLETYTLPFELNAVRVYHGFDGDMEPGFENDSLSNEDDIACYLPPLSDWREEISADDAHSLRDWRRLPYRMKPWQLALVQSLDISLQQGLLESTALTYNMRKCNVEKRHKREPCSWTCMFPPEYLQLFSAQSLASLDQELVILQPLISLTIRLPRFNWWTWTDRPRTHDTTNHLGIDPGHGGLYASQRCTCDHMLAEAQDRREGNWHGYVEDSWGHQISQFPDLTELVMEFETFQAKVHELEAVVTSAHEWTFPLGDDGAFELVWDGQDEGFSWEGALKGYPYYVPWLSECRRNLDPMSSASDDDDDDDEYGVYEEHGVYEEYGVEHDTDSSVGAVAGSEPETILGDQDNIEGTQAFLGIQPNAHGGQEQDTEMVRMDHRIEQEQDTSQSAVKPSTMTASIFEVRKVRWQRRPTKERQWITSRNMTKADNSEHQT